MEIKNIEDCFRLRLLRKIQPNSEKTKNSINMAKKRFQDAKEILKYNIYRSAITESYMAMFHASRALLYKDGVQEKNHYAVYIYIKEKYKDKIPTSVINLLNIHRIERHEVVYGLDHEPKKDEARQALNDAKLFIAEIEKLL